MSDLSGLELRRALLERLGWNVRREKVYSERRDFYVLIDPEKQLAAISTKYSMLLVSCEGN